ncbi:glutamyl-tRNA reductase [Sporolactobacillus sp. CQH2019]|uniref:glutamyl-tRNA reductase n=1 Tax=Sporolactobacillus sp. CQH2019 TaxID=3023512 RepID=UPI002367424D|nr:glutamyl-tRNA reductase [Sporolactobacillus sp. CQH2019]MDD9147712.1 glutamyl-tRNA reductase [Sporolactobacillus sp. CQH2019]
MHILAVGVNHHRAPVNVREKLALTASDLEKTLTKLRHTKSIFEDVIVSTCNRTEFYVVSDQLHTGRHYTQQFFADCFHISREDILPFLFVKEDREAVNHLFRVACGLDSMVLGETQILGQVRDSFLTAQKAGTTGTFFNELFKEAVTVAKHAQAESQINDHPVSVSYAAVELIKDTFGPLDDKRILLVGAGEMSQLALKYLTGGGTSQIMIANRTAEKAVRLADQFGGRAVPFESLSRCLDQADILIATTSAPDFLLSQRDAADAVARRGEKPIVIVDIAVPRNIDPDVARLDGVYLYDIDDLENIVASNLKEREKAALLIDPMIDEQLDKFAGWLRTLGVVPVITALRNKALSIHSETMKSIENKLPEMTQHERKVISKHAKSIINQLLRDPINKVKEIAGDKNSKEAMDLFIDIFNIADEVSGQQERTPFTVSVPKKEQQMVETHT